MTGRLRPIPGVIGLLDTRAPARGAPGAEPDAEPPEGSTRLPREAAGQDAAMLACAGTRAPAEPVSRRAR